MILCCCIYCKEERSAKGIHTHVDRTHLGKTQYSSGNNGKYEQIRENYKEKSLTKENEYSLSPKICRCGKSIDFQRRENKYCSSSCAASFSNIGKIKSEETKRKLALAAKNQINKRQKGTKTLIEKVCQSCNSLFYKETKFCSKECAYKSRFKNSCKNKTELEIYRKLCGFKFSLKDYQMNSISN